MIKVTEKIVNTLKSSLDFENEDTEVITSINDIT